MGNCVFSCFSATFSLHNNLPTIHFCLICYHTRWYTINSLFNVIYICILYKVISNFVINIMVVVGVIRGAAGVGRDRRGVQHHGVQHAGQLAGTHAHRARDQLAAAARRQGRRRESQGERFEPSVFFINSYSNGFIIHNISVTIILENVSLSNAPSIFSNSYRFR